MQLTVERTMNQQQYKNLKQAIVEKYIDGMSGRDLENFFYDVQYDNLSDYSESELMDEAAMFFSDEEIIALTSADAEL